MDRRMFFKMLGVGAAAAAMPGMVIGATRLEQESAILPTMEDEGFTKIGSYIIQWGKGYFPVITPDFMKADPAMFPNGILFANSAPSDNDAGGYWMKVGY